jgi:hypothetical protein
MRGIGSLFLRVLVGIVVFIIVRTIIEILHVRDVYPEKELAHLLAARPTALFEGAISWLIACAIAIIIWALADYFLYRRPNYRPIRIDYSNKANLEHLQSTLRRSTGILPSGSPITRRITYHELFVGVENTGRSTIRNVRLIATSLNLPPAAIELTFKPKSSETDRVDIQPLSTELFFVLSGYDASDVGMFSPSVIPADQYHTLCAHLESPNNKHIGATLMGWRREGIALLKNNGYVIDICIVADDVKPVHAIMVVDAREIIRLFVFKSRLHLKFLGLISKFLSQIGVGKIGRYKWPIVPALIRRNI